LKYERRRIACRKRGSIEATGPHPVKEINLDAGHGLVQLNGAERGNVNGKGSESVSVRERDAGSLRFERGSEKGKGLNWKERDVSGKEETGGGIYALIFV